MKTETTREFYEAATRFARQVVARMVGTEGRDGAMEQVPGVLSRAAELGLLTSTDPGAAGHTHGVWATEVRELGAEAASLVVLKAVAEVCAGVASLLHVQGLGVAALRGRVDTAAPAVACNPEDWNPPWETDGAGPTAVTVRRSGGGLLVLDGVVPMVPALPGCSGWVVAAERSPARAFWVPRSTVGAHWSEGARTAGLGAVRFGSLALDAVEILAQHDLGEWDLGSHIRRAMLGWSAIAAGNARGALGAARAYAGERRQGGRLIAEHDAVRLLLGGAAARVATSLGATEAALDARSADTALWRALALRLEVTSSCARAVTDCLQVLGGYGYMEDYRLEKRLRDALTLDVMGACPDTLRGWCASAPGGLP